MCSFQVKEIPKMFDQEVSVIVIYLIIIFSLGTSKINKKIFAWCIYYIKISFGFNPKTLREVNYSKLAETNVTYVYSFFSN